MKRLFLKIAIYSFLIFTTLELIVRVFHLYDEYPVFIINDANVKTYAPNQQGYSSKGNRLMNFTEYHINNDGYNSYREFVPTPAPTDIAIIGDSFIEGLHQNYYNSIGKKIESKLNNTYQVFEYGHSGYDFADQLHLISAYRDKFDLIDYIFIYIKYENDLKRNYYEPDQYWIDSQYFLTSRIAKKIKIFNYLDNIGLFEALRELKGKTLNLFRPNPAKMVAMEGEYLPQRKDSLYLEHFKTLIDSFGLDKQKSIFLLDSRTTSSLFLNYLDSSQYKYLDFGADFEKSKLPTTLIYDMHWNNHGRTIIANSISNYIKENAQN